ncbi:MAG: FtsX-like permease family protein [Actinobacteria bacterium]|nr:MAG: FtsX-like permease family protein [Actinomycetota bacterium]
MLAPRWIKVVRDLSSHRFRTALVVLSIAVGVFSVAVVMGAREVLLREFDTGYAWARAANATFNAERPFDQGLVRRVAARPEVADAEGRTLVPVRFRTLDGEGNPSSGWKTMRIQAVDDLRDTKVERVEVPEGTRIPGEGEILVEQSAKLTGDWEVGQSMELELPSGGSATLRVAGFAHDLNAVPSRFIGATTAFTTPENLELLEMPDGYNMLLVSFRGAGLTRERASEMAAAVRDEVLEPAGITVARMAVPEPGSHFLGDIFKAVSLLLLALGVLSLLLSGFLVVNTVSAIMVQHVRQVGIMKAVGGSAGQVSRMYFTMVTVYGALAVLVGIPAGGWAGHRFTEFAAGLLNFRITSYTPPGWVIALEVGVGMLVPVLAALVPVLLGARRSVVSALNATGMAGVSFGHSLVDRALGLVRGLPRPIALSLRNTFLRKGRLALTLTTLGLASAVVMAVVSTRASLLRTVDDLDSWWRYDVEVAFPQPVEALGAARVAVEAGGITGVESWVEQGAALVREDGSENQDIEVSGVPAGTDFVTPRVVEGRWLSSADEQAVVVNTDVTSAEDGLGVGDTVRLKIGADEREWTVVGVVTGQMMGSKVFVERRYLEGILGRAGAADRLLVKTDRHTRDGQEEAAAALEERLEDAGYAVGSVRTQKGMRDNLNNQFGVLVAFLVIMAALLASVGVIGLSGTMSINVIESTREIGVMRSIGGSHAWIRRIFVTEGVTIGLLAWTIGAVLAWPMSRALVLMLQGAIGMPLSFAFSWEGVFGWLGIVLVVAAVASLVPAFRASRVSVRDAIAYE